jgi:hypothetical protein
VIGALLGIVFTLIILGVLWWAAQRLLGLVPIAEPFATIINVVLVVVMVLIVLWVIAALLGIGGIHVATFGPLR